MRYFANENIPLAAIEALRVSRMDVVSITETASGIADVDILQQANRKGRILVTFDKDFAELVFREGKEALAGVILLRIRPRSSDQVAGMMVSSLTGNRGREGCFSVVTDTRIRMVPLPRR